MATSRTPFSHTDKYLFGPIQRRPVTKRRRCNSLSNLSPDGLYTGTNTFESNTFDANTGFSIMEKSGKVWKNSRFFSPFWKSLGKSGILGLLDFLFWKSLEFGYLPNLKKLFYVSLIVLPSNILNIFKIMIFGINLGPLFAIPPLPLPSHLSSTYLFKENYSFHKKSWFLSWFTRWDNSKGSYSRKQ